MVDSLYKFENKIRSVSDKDYSEMCESAKKVGEAIRDGYYFTTALKAVIRRIG